jgi:YbgC/YbaW family acyl-CoA thioester hydrolase
VIVGCKMFKIEVEVTEDVFEPPYYHVHHGEMLRYLERSRCEYLSAVGFPLSYFIDQGLLLVVSAIEVKYKREVKEGLHLVTVENPQMLDKRRVVVSQRIINPKGKDAVVAKVEFMCLSSQLKRAIAISTDFEEAFLKGVAES